VSHVLRSILPKAFNVSDGILLSMPSEHFVCLTIWQGDVQPYIGLVCGKDIKVVIVTQGIQGMGSGLRSGSQDRGGRRPRCTYEGYSEAKRRK
jgi:sterol 3beta-glucosyltransferase